METIKLNIKVQTTILSVSSLYIVITMKQSLPSEVTEEVTDFSDSFLLEQ